MKEYSPCVRMQQGVASSRPVLNKEWIVGQPEVEPPRTGPIISSRERDVALSGRSSRSSRLALGPGEQWETSLARKEMFESTPGPVLEPGRARMEARRMFRREICGHECARDPRKRARHLDQ